MFSIIIFAVLVLAAIALFWFRKQPGQQDMPAFFPWVPAAAAVVFLGFASFTQVSQSHIGVVTTFGEVQPGVLTEGAHFVLPVSKVHEVYLGQQKMDVKSEAGSRDMQSVHAQLSVLYVVEPAHARGLFVQNPTQSYPTLIVQPAIGEAFKAVVAQYTAEELITKRSEVSENIAKLIDAKLARYHLRTQAVNLVDFGFSKAFNDSIEEKVTASQKAETAKRTLERIEYEAKARIAQARGEAEAIAIQAAAVEKQGGAAYIQLMAIEKWNGQLPATMAGDGTVPFLSMGAKR